MTDPVGLHRFALVTAVMAFLLIIAGGLVTSTGSGLSVPDWPLSFGSLMPRMQGGVVYEHSHRVIATLVGLLTLVLAIWLWRRDTRRGVRILGLATLGAVIVQGVLGGLTVLLKLPTLVSLGHAVLAQSVFSLTIVLALLTSAGWQRVVHSSATFRTRRLALVTSGLILLQLILGAWMRHSNAGLAIPDFPLSYGGIVPPLGEKEISVLNEVREQANLMPVTGAQVTVNFLHRLVGLAVLLLTIILSVHTLRRYENEQRLREPVIVLQLLVVFQVFLGALAIWTGKGVEVSTGHVAVGALILATSVVIAVQAFRGVKIEYPVSK